MDIAVASILVSLGLANLGFAARILWLLSDYGARIKNLEREVFTNAR
ncbi:MAG: hypothetical protein PQ612_06470 [Rickettsiales bacterium]|nr:hypothetical protein [Pseudomonadota bacterium]MDA0966617.1 hypothetical protein [Pseudomonadota bacterium]MDG4543645.1 hypothetical protein [Rickettsiales bacterium]MDG4545792.1 hypothetical protein [Rickettsiales bacterium]MDG4547434.1 hypothetical protein [Rickettsiales bacterium]